MEKKVLKTSKEPLHLFQKVIQAIFEKQQSRDYFGVIVLREKSLRIFF
jgi:hypothetical protein